MKYLAVLFLLIAIFSFFPLDALPVVNSLWNQAYQENWNADSVEDILTQAHNAYVLLDPFDSSEAREAIRAIKGHNNIVSVYMSVGTGEDWREDFDELQGSLVEKHWGQWPGEYFIDHISDDVLSVMKARIEKAAAWGADMIEFDNMDWAFDDEAREKYGFHVSVEESLEYVNQLKDYAESLGVLCMAKNMTEGVDSFAGVTYESSPGNRMWWNAEDLRSFLNQGKLAVVFHYKERNPERAEEEYRALYGDKILVLFETRKSRGYLHVGLLN